ncbi:hypothetical protein [Desulfuribacillus alkaliarsenatis]|uniref:Uncharacterized protein n=1 Tax=Desulfuribacillus alkaliarsenatis TaxID=766136 RepID=A0A1E5FZX5_9FIRM|nr:hypothetical protein [Desulfuribacillus alkaliarsenatis]OEF96122.1 hypothetical protein BHF68_10345 [Desulfuribacillus alkaliarsenatis]
METKNNRSIKEYRSIIELVLIISIVINLYQFHNFRSIKADEHKQNVTIIQRTVTDSERLYRIINNKILDSVDSKEVQITFDSTRVKDWNAIVSWSRESTNRIEQFKYNRKNFSQKEYRSLQYIISSTGYILNHINNEISTRNPAFTILPEEIETIETIAEIYQLISNGITVTQQDVQFDHELMKSLIEPFSRIDNSGWVELMEEEFLTD